MQVKGAPRRLQHGICSAWRFKFGSIVAVNCTSCHELVCVSSACEPIRVQLRMCPRQYSQPAAGAHCQCGYLMIATASIPVDEVQERDLRLFQISLPQSNLQFC